jgi:hypothetical protein
MNRKVLTLACSVCLSASMLTACGGQANDDGNTRANNINGYSQYRNNGTTNNNGTTFDGTGYGEEDGARDVGANGVGVSGTTDGPGATGGASGNNR